jgi:hypothetical protein
MFASIRRAVFLMSPDGAKEAFQAEKPGRIAYIGVGSKAARAVSAFALSEIRAFLRNQASDNAFYQGGRMRRTRFNFQNQEWGQCALNGDTPSRKLLPTR